MNRIAVQRANGVARIGIVCDAHTADAIGITQKDGKKIWVRPYDGSDYCEACGENDHLQVEEGES